MANGREKSSFTVLIAASKQRKATSYSLLHPLSALITVYFFLIKIHQAKISHLLLH